MKKAMYMISAIYLTLFAGNTNVTTDNAQGASLSAEMKTFYSEYLIRLAQGGLVHDQFGQKHPIPKNGGKIIEFRKYDSLPKATTPLTEGVTPNGQKLNISTVTATVAQYGGYVELSDMLLLTAIDNNLMEATRLIADQASSTLDTITREVLVGGTNVQYAEGQVNLRANLQGGGTGTEANHYLTVNAIRMAVRKLKRMNAKKINGSYIGIIHPDCTYDLMNDPKWVDVKTYSDPSDMYEGEIGKIEGVRFVETSEGKIFANAAKDWVTGTGTGSSKVPAASARDVYATLIIGADAYGVTEITGGGLKHIVKQLGSAGTADPLDQRATVGWKATKTAERLVEQYMVRIETTSSYN